VKISRLLVFCLIVSLCSTAYGSLVDSGIEVFSTDNAVGPFSGTLEWEVFSPGGGYSDLLGATLDGTSTPGYDTDYTFLFELTNDATSTATIDYNQVAYFNLGTRSFDYVPWEGESYPGTTAPTGGGGAGGAVSVSYSTPGNGTARFDFAGGIAPGSTSDVYYFTWSTSRGLDLTADGSWVLDLGDYTTFDVDSTVASEATGTLDIIGGVGSGVIPEPVTVLMLGGALAGLGALARRRS